MGQQVALTFLTLVPVSRFLRVVSKDYAESDTDSNASSEVLEFSDDGADDDWGSGDIGSSSTVAPGKSPMSNKLFKDFAPMGVVASSESRA